MITMQYTFGGNLLFEYGISCS